MGPTQCDLRTPMACQSHIVDVDKQGATARCGCGKSIGITSLSISNKSYMSIYDIPTITALAHDPTKFARMITDLGPTQIGVRPDKVWFQGSSRGAETYKAIPLFAPEIDLRHLRLAYTNTIWGLRYLFQSYGPRSAAVNSYSFMKE